jgi:hypothetical protein
MDMQVCKVVVPFLEVYYKSLDSEEASNDTIGVCMLSVMHPSHGIKEIERERASLI